MRNVTIVESNVEPNKEHLWFYKGELKWFSPNGWEGVNKSSPTISPTSTPKPYPFATSTTTSTTSTTTSSTTTSTTSTSTVYLKNRIRFTNKTNADIGVAGAMSNNGSTISPPILPDQTHLLGQVHDDFELYAYYNRVQFHSLNIKAFKDDVLVLEDVPYAFNSGANSYTISFKDLVDKEVTDVIINGVIPAQPATTSTTTTSTTSTTTNTPTGTTTNTPF